MQVCILNASLHFKCLWCNPAGTSRGDLQEAGPALSVCTVLLLQHTWSTSAQSERASVSLDRHATVALRTTLYVHRFLCLTGSSTQHTERILRRTSEFVCVWPTSPSAVTEKYVWFPDASQRNRHKTFLFWLTRSVPHSRPHDDQKAAQAFQTSGCVRLYTHSLLVLAVALFWTDSFH